MLLNLPSKWSGRRKAASNSSRRLRRWRGALRLRFDRPERRKDTAYIPGMEQQRPLQTIPDQELLDRLAQLTRDSRGTEADLVAHIAEVDARKLYAIRACPSMFSYCTEVLHLSEPEAYLRITAARASRKHPMLLPLLADGRLHLSGIALLARHLTADNRDGVLARASHRSKREIEELVAELSPRPDAPVLVRKLPERREESRPRPLAVTNPERVGTGEPMLGADELTSGNQQPRPDGVATPPADTPLASRLGV